MAKCLLSLGSNHGEVAATLDSAVAELQAVSDRREPVVSSTHATAPVGGPDGQSRFLNAAVVIETSLEPLALLGELQRIESRFDRTRHERWGPRTLDIDLLLYERQVLHSPRLRVPHPRMSFRPFVLDPACQIAPDWMHPEINVSVATLRELTRSDSNFVLLLGDDGRWRGEVESSRPDVATRSGALRTTGAPPRLTIVCGEPPTEDAPSGPRLVLADCPREHWRAEVAAALECVWPTTPSP